MSALNIAGGKPSKPRSTQPCMFEILSWNQDSNITQSRYQPAQMIKETIVNPNPLCYQHINPTHIQQTYMSHSSPQKDHILIQTQQAHNHSQQKYSNRLKNSSVFIKPIKHQLNSYQEVNLKERNKSVYIQPVLKQQKLNQNQQQDDAKTKLAKKKNLKDFQLFTRILPNSAFTTYYGKPTFEAYGRGASCKNLKSYNVMPHKGQNHPKNEQTHHNALVKGRQIKSKSYLPRKPIDQPLAPKIQNQQSQVPISLDILPVDLLKGKRFSSISVTSQRKAGPPPAIISKSTLIKPKNNLTVTKKPSKKNQPPAPQSDGLKYMNKRQNLLSLLEEKRIKESQLAFKVTECYPKEWNCQQICKSQLKEQNWENIVPAGKVRPQQDTVAQLFRGKNILKQNNMHVTVKQ